MVELDHLLSALSKIRADHGNVEVLVTDNTHRAYLALDQKELKEELDLGGEDDMRDAYGLVPPHWEVWKGKQDEKEVTKLLFIWR